MVYFIAMICVLGIAGGQIIFKISASAFEKANSLFDPWALAILCSAFALYGFTSLAWVWVLQKVELGKVYPFMALAFVLVPIGSHLIFGERFQTQYFIGVAIIITGIVIAVRA